MKQPLSKQMAELALCKNYRYCLKQIKKSALEGKNETQILNTHFDKEAAKRLEAEGFTVTVVDYKYYEAYKINW